MSGGTSRYREDVKTYGIWDELVVGTRTYIRKTTGAITKSPIKFRPAALGLSKFFAVRCSDELHKGPPWKHGGPFQKWIIRNGGLDPTEREVWYGGNATYDQIWDSSYICRYGPSQTGIYGIPDFSWDYGKPSSTIDHKFGDEQDWGPTAWARFRPGRPGASLAVSLAELADATRMLSTTALAFRNLWRDMRSRRGKRLAKEVANQHLNNQFGWLPFVNDCRNLYDTYKNMDRMIHQLVRDNGQWIYRRGTCVDTDRELSDETALNYTAHYPIPTASDFGISSPNGLHIVRKYNTRRVWFCARFRYWIPNPGTVQWQVNARRKLYGLTITPEVIWELIPFSWLADWASNIGDNIANLDDGVAENLAAKYAYLMSDVSTEMDIYSELHSNTNGKHRANWTSTLRRKSRWIASPFGFGLTSSDFSARQWSILGALGMTRLL